MLASVLPQVTFHENMLRNKLIENLIRVGESELECPFSMSLKGTVKRELVEAFSITPEPLAIEISDAEKAHILEDWYIKALAISEQCLMPGMTKEGILNTPGTVASTVLDQCYDSTQTCSVACHVLLSDLGEIKNKSDTITSLLSFGRDICGTAVIHLKSAKIEPAADSRKSITWITVLGLLFSGIL